MLYCVWFETKILHKPCTEPYMGTKSQRVKETKRGKVKERKSQRDKESKRQRVKERRVGERKAKQNLRKAKKN